MAELTPEQQALVDAINEQVTQPAAAEIRQAIADVLQDISTKMSLSFQMVDSYRHRLDECERLLKTIQQELSHATHEQINARTGLENYRDITERRKLKIELLQAEIDDLRRDVLELRK